MGQPCARSREALAQGVQHGLFLCPRASSLASCRHIVPSNRLCNPFAMLQSTEALVKGVEGERETDSWLCQRPMLRAGCQSCPGSHLPRPPCAGEVGVIFPSKIRDSNQKKQFSNCGGRKGRMGRGSQSVQVQQFPNMLLTAWMLYISVFCLILAVK